MNEEISKRFGQLEANAAHLEHQVEQLNTVVIEQGRQLDQLKKLTQRQSTTLEAIESERIRDTSSKPPHYQ